MVWRLGFVEGGIEVKEMWWKGEWEGGKERREKDERDEKEGQG